MSAILLNRIFFSAYYHYTFINISQADVSVKIMDRSMREVEKKSLQPTPHILCKVCCTDSSNLPWKYIFNVCIPNYKEIKNEQVSFLLSMGKVLLFI